MRELLVAFAVTLINLAPAEATTVAWDGEHLAADSQSTAGDLKWFDCDKIKRVNDAWIGNAGLVWKSRLFCKWYEKQEGPPPDMEECSAIVVTGQKCMYYHGNNKPVRKHPPFAIGTGSEFAMGAMVAGCDARDAAAIASQLDENTGGKIVCVDTCAAESEE